MPPPGAQRLRSASHTFVGMAMRRASVEDATARWISARRVAFDHSSHGTIVSAGQQACQRLTLAR